MKKNVKLKSPQGHSEVRRFQVAVIMSKKGCPKCGGDLILKKGRYGHFISCHRYPMCKYNQDIEYISI